jgi:hypothetical protein
MAIGYTAAELMDQFREELGHGTSRPMQSLGRDEQELLRRMIERVAVQVAAKAIELNNAKLEQDLKPSSG